MRLIPLLLAVAATTTSVYAQALSERMTVNVVEVPVYVMRNTGAVVKGLTRDDFELFVNGEPHPIDYFDVLVSDAAPGAAAAAAPAQRTPLERRRLFVLLFDTLNLPPNIVVAAQKSAETFVASAPSGDTFAVAVTRRSGIYFVVPFTSDRVAVQRAIGTLRHSRAGDAFSLATLESERGSWVPSGVPAPDALRQRPPEPFGFADADDKLAFKQSGGAAFAAYAEEEALRMERLGRTRQQELGLGHLAGLAQRLAPLPGVKHVVLISPGHLPEDDSKPLFYIRQVHEAYRAAGVILNAVNILPRAPWAARDGGLMMDPSGLLKELAADTGGIVTPNLTSLRDMESVTYVVGFRPPANQKKNNSIRVKVKNAPLGAVVRHRRTYSTEPREGADDELFLADVIVNDIPQSGLTVDLDVQAQGEQVTMVTTVPGIELLSLGKDGVTNVDVFFYVFDENDVATTWTHVRVNLDHAKGKEFLTANPYTLRQRFSLPPGRYSAKTLLRVIGADVTGFERRDFVIAAP